MGEPAKPKTREQELRAAVKAAGMPSSVRRIYDELLDRAEFGTALLRDGNGRYWGPRSAAELAGWARVSHRTAVRALADLEGREWLTRRRAAAGSAHHHEYKLTRGIPWPERNPARKSPMSGAERTQRWRERRGCVTNPTADPSAYPPEDQSRDAKCASPNLIRDAKCSSLVTPTETSHPQVSGPFMQRGREGGERGGGKPEVVPAVLSESSRRSHEGAEAGFRAEAQFRAATPAESAPPQNPHPPVETWPSWGDWPTGSIGEYQNRR